MLDATYQILPSGRFRFKKEGIVRACKRLGFASGCISFVVIWLAPSAASAQAVPRLTGAGLFAADGGGNWGGLHYWNNVPDGFFWNLFLTQGDPATGAMLNGPDDATIAPDIPLPVGTHTFGLIGGRPLPGSGYDTGYEGLNLYLNGAAGPSISVLAPTAEPFTVSPNAAQVPDAAGNFTSGANTATFTDGAYTVQVVGLRWDNNPSAALDRVGGFNAVPDGADDLYGTMTLRVTAVPEPSAALVLFLLPAAAMFRPRRRRWP